MADPEAQAEFAELYTVVEDRHLPYPLVAINGELKLAGSSHFYQVLPLVEELLEAEPAAG
jgi:hypothetical protein